MPAQVSMPFEEFDAIRDANSNMRAEIKQLKEELLAGKFAANDGEVRTLHDALRAAMQVAGYAIANLSPEVNKRWPHAALTALAAGVRALPTCGPHDVELAAEMEKFARECEVWETKRKSEPERYVPEPHRAPPRAVVDAAALARAADDELARVTSSQLEEADGQ